MFKLQFNKISDTSFDITWGIENIVFEFITVPVVIITDNHVELAEQVIAVQMTARLIGYPIKRVYLETAHLNIFI